MAILKADILTFTNDVLNRNDTDIDTSIGLILRDLAKRHLLEDEDATQTLTSSSDYLSYPSDCMDGEEAIRSVVLTDSSGYKQAPLIVIPGGWDEYLLLMENYTSTDDSSPIYMIGHDRKIWLWPTPGENYTSSIWYYKRTSDPDSIPFSVDFTDALYFGAAMEVAISHKMADQISLWSQRYAAERTRLRIANTGG